MSDTPRKDYLIKHVPIGLRPIAAFEQAVELVDALERELNAANDRIKRLEEAGDMMEKLLPEGSICDKAAIRWTKAREAKL